MTILIGIWIIGLLITWGSLLEDPRPEDMSYWDWVKVFFVVLIGWPFILGSKI